MSLARPWSVLAAVALLAACGGGGGGGGTATAPDPVTLTSPTPSPANQNAITVEGATAPGLEVRVFAGGGCGGEPLQNFTAGPDGAFSFPLQVDDDSTTTIRAQAVDGKLAGPCGPPFTFVEDSTPPAPPAGIETVPASPSQAAAVVVTGAAEAGSHVELFADAACAAPAVAEATAQDGFTVQVSVDAEGAVTWWARATDEAGNASDCVEAVTYVRDLTPPGAPALLATTPANDRPRQETVIEVAVEADDGAEVALFADDACGAPAAATVVSVQGRVTLFAVTVPANQVTQLTARAEDAAGNPSDCSAPLAYENDRTPPPAPSLVLGAGQASPSQSAEALLAGGAEHGATVHVYASVDCSGPEVAAPVVASPADGGFEVLAAAAANDVTRFRAVAVDTAGNRSLCGEAVEYVNDTLAPAPPADLATTPPSPANMNDPVLGATAETGASVGLWVGSECVGAPDVSAIAVSGPGGNAFALPFHVGDDTDTALWVKAVDEAGNASVCTPAGAYVEDSRAPGVPVVAATTPAADRPRQEASIVVEVAADADATTALFSDDACLVPLAATPLPGGNGMSLFAVTVATNAVTSLHAQARDAAGNVSACSAALAYENDQTPPPAPSLALGAGQASPSQSAEALLAGDAERGATVHVYASVDCSGPEVAAPVLASPADGGFEVRAAAAANDLTRFRAIAVDAAGNQSLCGEAVEYVNDMLAPEPPADLATTPLSPANMNDPVLSGTAEPGANVGLWVGSECVGAPDVAALAVDGPGGNAFALPFHVGDDTVTALWMKAVDAAGNGSACAPAGAYVEDSRAPAVPVVVGTTPAADRPRQEASIVVEVAGDADATTALFSDDACLLPVAATALPGENGASLFAVTVPENAVTSLHAQARDVAGNVSACSAGVRYENDQVAPASPTLASAPGSPGKIVNPVLSGTAEKGAAVRLYREVGCTGTPLELTASAQNGSFFTEVTVPADAVTSFWASATDAAGNSLGCPAEPQVVYRQDSTPPADPASLAILPASPANDNFPVVHGTTEAGAAVKIYAFLDGVDPGEAPCAGTATGDGVANGGDGTGFAVSVAVADDAATRFWVQAVDAAGNPSRCVAAGTYVEDSQKPAAPVVSTAAPSPSQLATLQVEVAGEPGARVALYAGTGCAFPLVGAPVGGGEPILPAGGALAFVVTVNANQTTAIGARVSDTAGNASDCSAPVLYTHDTIAPAAPALAFAPASPSPSLAPVLSGTTEQDARVELYAGSSCAGAPLATPAVDPDGRFTEPLAAAPNAMTAFSVRATDLAGNTAPSSCAPIAYRHDDEAPPTPGAFQVTARTPGGGVDVYDGSLPTSDGGPTATGTVAVNAREVAVQIRFYAGTCAGPRLISGPVAVPAGTYSISIPVPRNADTPLAADAIDDAGNVSGCIVGLTYRHDDTPPAFAGLATATATATDTVRLQWTAATDTVSPESKLVYEICQAPDWSGCLVSYSIQKTVAGSGLATYTTTMGGLTGGQRYTFLVRARDEAGNRDPNAAQHVARTYGDGAVAVASGGGESTTASSPRFTCVLDAGGRVQCQRKAGPADQLGAGVGGTGPVFLGGPAVAVSAGESHACAVRQDGVAYCWGSNVSGQVSADLTKTSFALPQQVPFGAGAAPAVAVECGRFHTCALLADGTVRCWGANEAGQLGGGAVSATRGQGAVTGLAGVVAIAAGEKHTCALRGDGTAWCWGDRTKGQLGDGTPVSPVPGPALAPVRFGATATSVPTLDSEGIQAIDAGWNHTCVLTTTARMWCTGANADGQLGLNDTVTRATPVPLGVTSMHALALGRNHSCAVRSTGTAMCWGDAQFNQLGTWVSGATAPDALQPTNVPSAPNAWQAIFAGGDETCAIRAGVATCWGFGGVTGTNDLGSYLATAQPQGQPVSGPPGTRAIAVGRVHTCALTGDGLVRCAGSNAAGQLGTGDGQDAQLGRPVVTLALRAALVAGGDTSCAGDAQGATCWGSNSFGQIGDANPGNWPGGAVIGGSRPVPTSPRSDWPVAVADHACGMKGNGAFGAAECWGRNDRDQLGAETVGQPTATGVNVSPSPVSVRSVTVGALHSCAVLRDGEVDCWGDNLEGQLGTDGGETLPFRTAAGPIFGQVDGAGDFLPAVEVDAGGGDTTCARFVDGQVWCWGRNEYGQLGRATSGAPSDAALGVSGLSSPATSRAVDVAVGKRHACAVVADGTVRCWGANEAGQLGDGTTTDRHAPVVVAGLAGARQVVVGDAHTCARLADGSVRCWGANASGQLADGTATGRTTPVAAETLP